MPVLTDYLTAHPKKYLIFDFDGTLFSLDLPWHIYQQEMDKVMHDLDAQYHANVPAQASLNAYENLLVKQLGQIALEKRWAVSAKFESEHLVNYRENHELTDFIRQRHQDFQGFFIWSSNMHQTIEKILKESSLGDFFRLVVAKDDVQFTKPDPEGFEKFILQPQSERSDYLMIGNSRNDQAAAANTGIEFWLVEQSS